MGRETRDPRRQSPGGREAQWDSPAHVPVAIRDRFLHFRASFLTMCDQGIAGDGRSTRVPAAHGDTGGRLAQVIGIKLLKEHKSKWQKFEVRMLGSLSS